MADSDYNGGPLIAIIALFLTLTTTSVLLRVYVRLRITRSFDYDDWFMTAAQINFVLDCIALCVAVRYGLGRHNATLTLENQIGALKYQALATLGYVSNMMFIKISIALFLLRLAVKKTYVWILRVSIGVVAIWSIAIFIYDLFQCVPVAAQWDITIKNPHCVSGDSFASAAYSISVMTILTDWLFALLPIPMIWNVQMSTQAKLTVTFILGLGIFASIATIIRLKYIVDLINISDTLFTGTTAMIWTITEPGLAITAASLIALRPLLRAMHFPGFESNDHGQVYPSSRRSGRKSYSGRDPQALSLRNDIPEGNWTSTVKSPTVMELKSMERERNLARTRTHGGSMGNPKDAKSMMDVREEELDLGGARSTPSGSEVDVGDGGGRGTDSEEYILDDAFVIRRTVDVMIKHDRAN